MIELLAHKFVSAGATLGILDSMATDKTGVVPLGDRLGWTVLLTQMRTDLEVVGLDFSIDHVDRLLTDIRDRKPTYESLRAGILELRFRLQGQLESLENSLKTIQEDKPEIKKKQAEIDRKSPRLRAVEQRIASLYDDNQYVNRFRIWVAVAFSALVFAVILGFYWIVNQHNIATTIFSGEMGMQFVTLFLIVIAIILFGIIGTLEGRELAALLGGLSGYILGRASDTRRRAPQAGQDTKEEAA